MRPSGRLWCADTGTATRRRRDRDAAVHEAVNCRLSDPFLKLIWRSGVSVGEPSDVGGLFAGHHGILALTDGTLSGLESCWTLHRGVRDEWQNIRADSTVFGDVCYMSKVQGGNLLNVQSRGMRHEIPTVFERFGRGEDVDAGLGECTFGGAVKGDAEAGSLDWLGQGVLFSVGCLSGGAVHKGQHVE